MKKIREGSERFLFFSEGTAIVRADVLVDTAEELPAVDAFYGRRLAMGSIAWDISSGDFYGLNSSGEWVKQGDE